MSLFMVAILLFAAISASGIGAPFLFIQQAQAQSISIETSADFHGGKFFGSALLEVIFTDPAHATDPAVNNASVSVTAFGELQAYGLAETGGTSGEFVLYVKVDDDNSAAELPVAPVDPYSNTMTRLYIGPAGVAGNYPPTSGTDVREELAVTSASIVEGGFISFDYAGLATKSVTYDDTAATITLDRVTAGAGNIIRVTISDQDANLDPTMPEAFFFDNSILDASGATLDISNPSAFLETGDNIAQFEFPIVVAGTATPGTGALTGFTFPASITIDLSDMKSYSPPSGTVSVVSASIDLENSDGILFASQDPIPLQRIFRNSAFGGLGVADPDRNIDSQVEDTIPAGGVTIAVEGVTATYTTGGATITTSAATSGIIGMDHELDFSSDPGQLSFAVVGVAGTGPNIILDPISVSVTAAGTSPDVHIEIPFTASGPVTDEPLGTLTLVATSSENVVDLTAIQTNGDPYIVVGPAPTLSMGPSNTQNLAVISSPTTLVDGIDFEETGDNTGGFAADTGFGGRIPLTVGPDSISPTSFSLLPSTIGKDPAIVVTYFDPVADPTGADVFHLITAISSDPASLDGPGDAMPSDQITLTLSDADLNISSDSPDVFTVPIAASEADFLALADVPHSMGFFLTVVKGNIIEVPGYNVTFVETGSGVFEGEVDLSVVLAGLDTAGVDIEDGDEVEFVYNDYYANSTTGTFVTLDVPSPITFDRATYSLMHLPTITVMNASADTSPAVDTVTVNVFSDTDLVGLDLTLTETAAHTAVFEGMISFTTVGVSGGSTLLVSEGDTITAVYGSANATAIISPAIFLDKTNYATEAESPEVTVVDISVNTNPSAMETVTVSVESDTSTAPLLVTLDETDDDTGIFTGSFDLTTSAMVPCPTCLHVSDGDTITVAYSATLAPIIATATFGTGSPDATPPAISAVSDSPDPFSPNGDGTNDTTTISFTSDEAGTYDIVINGTDGNHYQSLTGSMIAGVNNVIWNGSTFTDPVAPAQDYLYYILAQDASGNARPILGPDGTITLDVFSVATDKATYAMGETVMVSGDVGDVIVNATDVVSVSSVGLTDLLGNPTAFQPGVQSLISFDVDNLQATSQPFVATIQARQSDGTIEAIMWQTGTLAASSTTQIGLSWTPQADDDYTIRILVLSDLSTTFLPLFRGATYDVRNDITTFDTAQAQAVVHILNPSAFLYRFDQVEVLNDGSFTDSFILAGPFAELGDYTLTAVHGGDSAQTTFTLSAVPTTVSVEVSDNNPAWGEDVFANVTVANAQAGDYVELSWGNGETFTYPAFAGGFSGQLELAVFAYDASEVGSNFDVNATLYNNATNPVATSNTVSVTVDKRPATLTLKLPSSVVNGTIFTASGNLADGFTGFGLSGRTITFSTIPGISLGAVTTQGIDIMDPNGIEIVSCPVPQCTHENPNASTVNLLVLNDGAVFDLPPGVALMALTLQDMSGTVTVEVTRNDGSTFTATSDPAGINLATLMLSARDASHQTQFLQSVEIISTSLGEQFATSKIELSDIDADPTTLVSAMFDKLATGSYGSSLTVAPGSYYSSAPAPLLVRPSIAVTADFAGDLLYHPQAESLSFDTTLGFDLVSAGIGGFNGITANANPNFTVLSCSAMDPDTDGDGLCDSWEEADGGIPYACPDGTCLYVLPTTTVPISGTVQVASKFHKDIFVEIDAMQGHEPLDGALKRVIDAFAQAPVQNPDGTSGITLHIIKDQMDLPYVGAAAGTIFNAWVDPVPGGSDQNPTNDYFGIKSVNYGTTDEERTIAELKNARANAIRYSLWVGNIGTSTTSGLAEDLGNDMIVSLGSFGGADDGHGANQGTETEQAATFMHELGHVLNLKHGGPGEIVTEIDGMQADTATISSGGSRIYPRETTLEGYTVTAMGPGSGTVELQQVVEFSGPVNGINSLAVSSSGADSRLDNPSISIDAASTSTTKIFNIHYQFEVPHAEPMENANYAINFGTPNSGTYLTAASSDIYDVDDEDFWLAGMFKRTSDSGGVENLVTKQDGSDGNNPGYDIDIAVIDAFRVRLGDGSKNALIISTEKIQTNIWYVFGVSVDRPNSMSMFLYNIQTGTLETKTIGISSLIGDLENTQTLTIGRNSHSNGAFFPGQVDNLIPPQIGQTLTLEQFLAIAQGDFSIISPTNLYDFDDISSNDVIGNDNLIMHGSPIFSLGITNTDTTINEMSLGQLKINFNVVPNVNIMGFGTPAYPSITDIIPEDNSRNCKPNYRSILSYSRQMDNYLNGPGEHVLDYSRGNYAPLIETDLDGNLGLFSNIVLGYPNNVIIYGSPEAAGVQKVFTYGPGESVISIDWETPDAAGGIDGMANINNLSIDGCSAGGTDEFDTVTFYDYNDWNNIKLNWKENPLGTFDGITRAANKAAVEMTQEIAQQIEEQVSTIQIDMLTEDKILYGESVGVSGSTSNAPENATLLIDWGDGTTEEFEGVIDPLTGNWPLSGMLNHTYGSSATGERRIFASMMTNGSIEASSSGTTVLVLRDTTAISLELTPSTVNEGQEFTLTGMLSNLDHPEQGVVGRTITFTSSDPEMTIAPTTTDGFGNFMQTAIAGSIGSVEIIAHFEIPFDTDEDIPILPSQSPPQTLVIEEGSSGDEITFSIMPPIKADGSGVYKQKSTIPIKFQLADSDGNFINDAIATLRLVKIVNGVGGAEVAPEDGAGSFDVKDNYYQYNLKTKSMDIGSWGILVYLDYGTETQKLLDDEGDGYTVTIILR